MIPTILLIEDEAPIRELLTVRLRAAGYGILTAPDAQAGVQAAHQTKPDVILLDLKMPAGGGLSVLKNLKTSMHTSQIPVIVITGTADNDMKRQLLEFGIKTYIQKPFQPDELLQAIAKTLTPTRS